MQANAENKTIAVLLLDGLNTPPQDQIFVKQQMLKFLARQYDPNTKLAVIALTNKLAVLQNFTQDPLLLRGALDRYTAETDPNVLLLRVDAGLFFGNIEAVSERIEEELAAHGAARHLVLVLSAVNAIDSSALFGLLELNQALARRDVRLHLAEVKGPVLDRLRASALLRELSGRLFLSTANAWEALVQHGT